MISESLGKLVDLEPGDTVVSAVQFRDFVLLVTAHGRGYRVMWDHGR